MITVIAAATAMATPVTLAIATTNVAHAVIVIATATERRGGPVGVQDGTGKGVTTVIIGKFFCHCCR